MNDKKMASHPDHVMRTDQTIVAWDDVPEYIQKKILSGTMTEEDWSSDWEKRERIIVTENSKPVIRDVEDVVSEMFNDMKDRHPKWGPKHIHVFRKEYDYCMIGSCRAKKSHSPS
jgi:hypothetical protein